VLGKYSYSMYLIHVPIKAAIRQFVYSPDRLCVLGSAFPGQIVFCALSTAVTLACSYVIWILFERHFLRLKQILAPPCQSVDKSIKQEEPKVVALAK
jgi:peptidoglycan/LPS O-acetylase OafA/YrhL